MNLATSSTTLRCKEAHKLMRDRVYMIKCIHWFSESKTSSITSKHFLGLISCQARKRKGTTSFGLIYTNNMVYVTTLQVWMENEWKQKAERSQRQQETTGMHGVSRKLLKWNFCSINSDFKMAEEKVLLERGDLGVWDCWWIKGRYDGWFS